MPTPSRVCCSWSNGSAPTPQRRFSPNTITQNSVNCDAGIKGALSRRALLWHTFAHGTLLRQQRSYCPVRTTGTNERFSSSWIVPARICFMLNFPTWRRSSVKNWTKATFKRKECTNHNLLANTQAKNTSKALTKYCIWHSFYGLAQTISSGLALIK